MKLFNIFLDHINSYIAGETISDTDLLEILPAVEDLLPKEDVDWDALNESQDLVKPVVLSPTSPEKEAISPDVSALGTKGKHIREEWNNEEESEVSKPVIPAAESPAAETLPVMETRIKVRELTAEETTKLLLRSRAAGATVHGAFTLAASLALAMLLEQDVSQVMKFEVVHTVDLRRILPTDIVKNSCAIMTNKLATEVALNSLVVEEFWEVAKQVTSAIHEELAIDKIVQRVCAKGWVEPNDVLNMQFKSNSFAISNMRNVSRIFPGTGKYVEVTKIVRSTAKSAVGALLSHKIITFRGCFMYNMDYNVPYISDDLAEDYTNLLFEVLKTALEMP